MNMNIKFRCPECGSDKFANIAQPIATVADLTATEIVNKCLGSKRGAEREPTIHGTPTYDIHPCTFTWRATQTHSVMVLEMTFDSAREYELAIRAIQTKNTVKLLFGGK